jgi:AcrR family transcriptional regulator
MAGDSLHYHHGDLRQALVQAGLGLARQGGTEALRLRAVTRAVGVTPTAAYRHFADQQELVQAVAAEAQDLLAAAMLKNQPSLREEPDPGRRAVHQLREIGRCYIEFALAEPGWFDVAFLAPGKPRGPEAFAAGRASLAAPFRLLLEALDGMAEAGVLTPEQRLNAEWVCWSGVHGFADLVNRGPLKGQDRAVIDQLAAHIVDALISGLQA